MRVGCIVPVKVGMTRVYNWDQVASPSKIQNKRLRRNEWDVEEARVRARLGSWCESESAEPLNLHILADHTHVTPSLTLVIA